MTKVRYASEERCLPAVLQKNISAEGSGFAAVSEPQSQDR